MHGSNLLGRAELDRQAVRRVRSVVKDLTLLSLVDRLLGNTVAAGQSEGWLRAASDPGARAAGVVRAFLCRAIHHECKLPVDCNDSINSLSTAWAMNTR